MSTNNPSLQASKPQGANAPAKPGPHAQNAKPEKGAPAPVRKPAEQPKN